MGQSAEYKINPAKIYFIYFTKRWQGKMAQMRKDFPIGKPGFSIRTQRLDPYARMTGQKPHKFGPRITASSKNYDIFHHLYFLPIHHLAQKHLRHPAYFFHRSGCIIGGIPYLFIARMPFQIIRGSLSHDCGLG